jgi:hypothetical protein
MLPHIRRSWFRPARTMPVEAAFIAGMIVLATVLYALAVPRCALGRTCAADLVAPPCADARQPCRGRV